MDLKEGGVECGENRVARLMKAVQIRFVRSLNAYPKRLAGRHSWRPISCSVNLPISSQTRLGWPILRISGLMKAGYNWLWWLLVLPSSCWLEYEKKLRNEDYLGCINDGEVIIHSDQDSQYGGDEFNRWCKYNRLSPSMSRRGNCWDNAVAKAFFSNLKSEQIKRKIYPSHAEVKAEIFEYIDGFYNRVRCHKHLNQLSPL